MCCVFELVLSCLFCACIVVVVVLCDGDGFVVLIKKQRIGQDTMTILLSLHSSGVSV